MRPLAFVADRLPSGGAVRPIPIDLDRTCMTLVVGGSGSGKSIASMLLTSKVGLHINNPSVTSKAGISKAWVLDFKGEDTLGFLRGVKDARYYQYADCMRGLEDYYAMFQARLSGDPDRSFRLLWVDEWASMILNLPKKEAEAAKSMLSTILMMGRSMGCQVLTSVQRASAELFSQGARDNYGVCLALGNISKESAAMLGFDRDEFLPVTSIGGGHLLLNGTEQRPVQVPFIGPRGMERMKADILRVVTR